MLPILEMLRTRVIPWTKSEDSRLIMARSVMKKGALPADVSLSRRPLQGSRIILRNRHIANRRAFSAHWPQSNRQEMTVPKLACVVDGAADYLLGDYCVHTNKGTFILIPPHMPHHCLGPFLDEEHLSNGHCTILFAYSYKNGIFFWFSRSADGKHINNMANNYLVPDITAAQLFHMAMDEAFSFQEQSKQVCQSLLFAFFMRIVRDIEAKNCMSVIPVLREQQGDSDDFSSQITTYISANLHKRLRVEDAAMHMYMSVSHFSRTIRREMGISFVELMTRCRLERAQELLKGTDWSVEHIAGYVGLKSTAYFYEFFRQHMGCTPIEYRQKHKEK